MYIISQCHIHVASSRLYIAVEQETTFQGCMNDVIVQSGRSLKAFFKGFNFQCCVSVCVQKHSIVMFLLKFVFHFLLPQSKRPRVKALTQIFSYFRFNVTLIFSPQF